MYLSDFVKLTKIADHTTAATTDVTSAAVDMAGYDGCLFITSYSVCNDNNYLTLQQSSDDGSSDSYDDVAGSKVVTGTSASNEDTMLDVFQPGKRYLKIVAKRGTSSTLESIWALQYCGRSAPQVNTVTGTQIIVKKTAPAEGTP